MNARKISFLAMLVALSVVGRIGFNFIPNVQPATTIIILASFIVKPYEAIIIASLSTIVSNLILGNGIWTFWQILIWAIIGLLSGLIGKFHMKIPFIILVIYAGFCGLLYGFFMSIPSSMTMGIHFWTYYVAGISFDISHAIGNMIFFTIFYPVFFQMVKKMNLQ